MGVVDSANRVTDHALGIINHWIEDNQTSGATDYEASDQVMSFTETSQPVTPHVNSTDRCLVLELSGSFSWANAQDPVTYWVKDLVDAIAHGVMQPVLLLVCVPTNIINAIVFYRHGLSERINLCVFTLSLIDLLYVLLTFCFYNSDRLFNYLSSGMRISVVNKFSLSFKLTGLFYLSTVTFFIRMLIASERCFCVVSPLTSKTALKTKSFAAILFLSSAVILAGGFVCGLRYDLACMLDKNTNITTEILFASEFYLKHPKLIDILNALVYGIGIPGFCFIVVIATTTITVIKLKNMVGWREQSVLSTKFTSARVTKETTLTRMLVGTSVLFIVLSLPIVTVQMVMGIVSDFSPAGRYRNLFMVLLNMSIACTYVNSSVNFFVYYSLGTNFRRTVHAMFRKIHKYKHTEISQVRNDV